MFEGLLLGVALAAPTIQSSVPALRIDEQIESAAAVAAAFRYEPITGRLVAGERDRRGDWRRTPSEGAPAGSSLAFAVELDAATGRLLWRTLDGARTEERVLTGALALEGANLLRLEVANFDARATATLARLELRIDGQMEPIRRLGREAMTSDKLTLWAPELARGFRLTGEIAVKGVAAAPRRVFVDVGIGRGRRVEVEIDGRGEVHSEPPSLVRVGNRKVALGYFDAEAPVVLAADGEQFELWRSETAERHARRIELPPAAGESSWLARFETPSDGLPEPRADRVSPEAPYLFSNLAAIDIPNNPVVLTSGPASPYPSTITVGGPIGAETVDVNVSLLDVSHTFPDDIDVLVVSPSGTAVILMSDACGGTDLVASDLTFDDEAAAPLTDNDFSNCAVAAVQPTNYGSGDTFNAPAPGSAYQGTLAAFDHENPNGDWGLWVMDDLDPDSGSIAGGWQLAIETDHAYVLIPGSGTSGPADPYPFTRTIAANDHAVFGAIVDVDVTISDFWHQFPDDVDILLVAPNGDATMLMSDACGLVRIPGSSWVFDDEAADPMSDTVSKGCHPGSWKPTDFEVGEALPAPAPAPPYAVSLAVFDGDDPVGTWSLFIRDDAAEDVGFLSAPPSFQIRTVGVFRDDFESQSLCAWSTAVPPPFCG